MDIATNCMPMGECTVVDPVAKRNARRRWLYANDPEWRARAQAAANKRNRQRYAEDSAYRDAKLKRCAEYQAVCRQSDVWRADRARYHHLWYASQMAGQVM